MTSPTLELSFRRAEVTAFWLVVTVGVSAVAWLTAQAAGASWLWASVSLGVLVPGLIDRRWFELGIAAWNKLIRISLPPLRAYVLRVSYYVLFGTMRLAGSTLDSRFSDDAALTASRWVRRTTSGRTGVWTVCLQPVLLLLTLLGDQQQPGGPPSGTYTLY